MISIEKEYIPPEWIRAVYMGNLFLGDEECSLLKEIKIRRIYLTNTSYANNPIRKYPFFRISELSNKFPEVTDISLVEYGTKDLLRNYEFWVESGSPEKLLILKMAI